MSLYRILFFLPIILANNKIYNSDSYCITFMTGGEISCESMCNYCFENLGTNNFYFTDWICQNQNGRCIGDPSPYEEYTCCTSD